MVGMNALIEDTLRLSQELGRNVRTLETIVKSLGNVMSGRGFIHTSKSMEVRMDSLRDALIQSASGRTLVVQAQDDIRQANIRREKAREESRKRRIEGIEIAKRIRTLKELVHYTFVEYPKSNRSRVRFDVYQASKETVRSIGAEGGDAYERLTRTLQFAHTSRKAFEEAIQSVEDCQHDFSDYESSDAVRRHAA
jgi:hypothetical protein